MFYRWGVFLKHWGKKKYTQWHSFGLVGWSVYGENNEKYCKLGWGMEERTGESCLCIVAVFVFNCFFNCFFFGFKAVFLRMQVIGCSFAFGRGFCMILFISIMKYSWIYIYE